MIARWEDATRTLWLDAETFSRVVRVHAEVLRVVMPGVENDHIRALMLEQTLDRLTVILGGPIPLGDWHLKVVKEPMRRLRWATPTLREQDPRGLLAPSHRLRLPQLPAALILRTMPKLYPNGDPDLSPADAVEMMAGRRIVITSEDHGVIFATMVGWDRDQGMAVCTLEDPTIAEFTSPALEWEPAD